MQCMVNVWDSLPQDGVEAESRARVSEGLDTCMEEPCIHGSWAEVFPPASLDQ